MRRVGLGRRWTDSKAVTLGAPTFPPGQVKYDETFGKEPETHRGRVVIQVPLEATVSAFTLTVTSQGYADASLSPLDAEHPAADFAHPDNEIGRSADAGSHLAKAVDLALAVLGATQLEEAAAGADNPREPLRPLLPTVQAALLSSNVPAADRTAFQPVRNETELNAALPCAAPTSQ